MLDIRSYRSRNDELDTSDRAKTMLGAEQLAWVKRELAASRATWKLVTTGAPLSAPTGGLAAPLFGRDGWASGSGPRDAPGTGFERELVDLFAFLDEQRIENVVFLGADIHQALAVRYTVDLNNDGSPLRVHEFIAGPFSSAPRIDVPTLDPTLNPTLLYGEGGFFNFGHIQIERGSDEVPRLHFSIRDADGAVRPASVLQLDPVGAP
jgi:alkaline phosphatase D